MEVPIHHCRDAVPDHHKISVFRVADLIYEQSHVPVTVNWQDGREPPLLPLAALDAVSKGNTNQAEVRETLEADGIICSQSEIAEALGSLPSIYGVETLEQAALAAFRAGDLGFTASKVESPQAVRHAVRMALSFWSSPNALNSGDLQGAYDALGTDFPPAFIRKAYEQGYITLPSTNVGWYHRRVFVPHVTDPSFRDKSKEALLVIAKDLPGDSKTLYSRLVLAYNDLGLAPYRKAELALTLAITTGKIAPPDVDMSELKIPQIKGIEALVLTACGLAQTAIAQVMQLSTGTLSNLVEKASSDLGCHRSGAAISRLFSMGIFLAGQSETAN